LERKSCPRELKLSFSGILHDTDALVFGAATNDFNMKCHQVHVKLRVNNQGYTSNGKPELVLLLKNASGETIATGCKWSLPYEWSETEVTFDDKDSIVRLSGPGCRYEIWYKVVKGGEHSNIVLCIDYFSLVAKEGSSSTSISSSSTTNLTRREV
jgi:hypothetical protein